MNDVTVVYNDYTLPNFYDKFSFNINYTQANLSAKFIVLADTEQALVLECETLEAKLRERFRTLSVKFGDTKEYEFNHSKNSGFLQSPSLSKIPNELATQTSRSYQFSVSISLPANQSGFDYRQEASISISKNVQQRRMVNINGKYTAGGENSSYVNYETYGKPWHLGIAKAILGDDYPELLSEQTNYEHENKILNFSVQYQEKSVIRITYNNYQIPNSYSSYRFSHTYNQATFSCSFAVDKDLASTLEERLRQKNKDLSVVFDGNTIHNFTHASTGFLAFPSLSIKSNTNDKDERIFYDFSVRVELPADATGYGYRRDGNYNISYTSSRKRTVNFTVVYTAGGGNSALVNYLNGARNWASSILNLLGGTWELIDERTSSEMETKLVNGTLVYSELLTNDIEASKDYNYIQSASCDYSIQFGQEIGMTQLNESIKQNPSVDINISYNAFINKELVTSDQGLDDIYKTSVRPWILKQARNVLGTSSFNQVGSFLIVNNENYSINPHNYRISGNISVQAPNSSNAVVSLSEIITSNEDTGIGYEKIWDGLDHTFNIYGIGRKTIVKRTRKISQLNSMPNPPEPLGNQYVLLDTITSVEKRRIGHGSSLAMPTGVSDAIMYIVTYGETWLYTRG
jgi:hypothetical protein